MNKRTIRVQAAAFDAVEQATKAMRDAAQEATPGHRRRPWHHAYVVAGAAAGMLTGTAIVWGLHHATVGSCKLARVTRHLFDPSKSVKTNPGFASLNCTLPGSSAFDENNNSGVVIHTVTCRNTIPSRDSTVCGCDPRASNEVVAGVKNLREHLLLLRRRVPVLQSHHIRADYGDNIRRSRYAS